MTEQIENKIDNLEEIKSLLNKILNGEEMAVEVYNHYLNQLETDSTIELLEQFKGDHEEHIQQLSARIEELGGEPDVDSALGKVVSKTMMEIGDLLGTPSEDEILDKIYEGEDKGINQVEEQLKEKLDPESQELVNQILTTDKKHLEQLKEAENSYN